MSKASEHDLQTLRGIVERRAKIQMLSVQLFEDLSSVSSGSLEATDKEVSELLIGCVFSLWRAVFLLDVERASEKIGSDAKEFLETVIRENAVTFQTDRNKREWVVGYYLNNARYRLEHAAKYPDYRNTLGADEFSDFIVGVPGTDIWDECLRVLEKQLVRFRQNVRT
jgi:hypothetical protein